MTVDETITLFHSPQKNTARQSRNQNNNGTQRIKDATNGMIKISERRSF